MTGMCAVVGPMDFFAPEHRANPYPAFAALREQGPVVLPGVGVAVGDHATCSAVLRDGRMSVERRRNRMYAAAVAAGMIPDPERDLAEAPFLFRDPPVHTRLRGLVAKAFTRRVVADLEPRIEEITARLLDAARDRGALEIVEDLAYPLPVAVICALLGVPAEDHDTFAGWSKLLASSLDPQMGTVDVERFTEAVRAGDEFRTYFRALAAERRREPRDDLLSGLVHAESDGSTLSETELLSTCILLLVAGHETTVGLIANSVQALLRFPSEWELLVADQSLAQAVADEALRYDPPVQLTGRTATEEVQIGSVTIGDGDLAMLAIAAAGRDPLVFPSPDTFDVRRTPDDGALRHLAFSLGTHFCLGAPLARLEATVALRALAARLDSPEFAATPEYKDNLVLRGLSSLPLTFAELR